MVENAAAIVNKPTLFILSFDLVCVTLDPSMLHVYYTLAHCESICSVPAILVTYVVSVVISWYIVVSSTTIPV